MRVLFLTGRELAYSRNDVIYRAFRRIAEVDVFSGSLHSSLITRSVQVLARAWPSLTRKRYDLVFVGFYGHILMLPFRFFKRAPVIFDAFISNYDSLAYDRKQFAPQSLGGQLALLLDRASCAAADQILLDTARHREYFNQTIGIPEEKIEVIPVGCNEELFHPRSRVQSSPVQRVLYYSTYFPLHGVETVVRAAEELKRSSSIQFRIIGDGPEFPRIRYLVEDLKLPNLELLPPIPLDALPAEIDAAGICLGGHFGTSDKASRVVAGKIYQILAMNRPLIATTTPANLDLLCHGENAWLCPPDNPHSLAMSILTLAQDRDLSSRLADNGYKLYLEHCSEGVIAQELGKIVEKILTRK